MHAEGSCIIKMGDTHIICTATIEDRVPPFIKGSGLGGLLLNMVCYQDQPVPECEGKQLLVSKAAEQLRYKD